MVAGFVEHYDRPQTRAQIGDLEVVPRRQIPYGGTTVEEMDTDAVIARRPQVVLVDELAHTNAPGSGAREKRWQDVEAIRDAGIDVISTMNVQHLESVADIVESITGAPVRERIPDRVLDAADEVELIDMSPRALRQRLQHGNVYPPGRAQTALDSFFREGNLTALRELALRRTAQQVDEQLQEYMLGHGIDASWPASERVLVCVDHQPLSKQLVRRAWRMASRLRAELLAAYIEPPDWEQLPFQVQKAVEANLRFAEDLGARVVRRKGRDVSAELAAAGPGRERGPDRDRALQPRPLARADPGLCGEQPAAPGAGRRHPRHRGRLLPPPHPIGRLRPLPLQEPGGLPQRFPASRPTVYGWACRRPISASAPPSGGSTPGPPAGASTAGCASWRASSASQASAATSRHRPPASTNAMATPTV